MSKTIIEPKKKQAIYIDLKDEGGKEVYAILDRYRFSKGYTWKQIILQDFVFAMQQDNFDLRDIDVVIDYMTK